MFNVLRRFGPTYALVYVVGYIELKHSDKYDDMHGSTTMHLYPLRST